MKLLKDIWHSFLLIIAFFICGLVVYALTIMSLNSTILFYDGLSAFLIILTISYSGIFIFSYRQKNACSFCPKTLFTAAFAGAMLVYSFHITLPTIIDRSISLFLLSRMEGSGSGVPVDKLQELFLNGYVNNYSAICRRLDEQVLSGNIYFKDNKYYLSENGVYILENLRLIARLVKRDSYYITNILPKNSIYNYTLKNGECLLK